MLQELENFDRKESEPLAADSQPIQKDIDFSTILSSVLDFQDAPASEGRAKIS